MATAGNKVYFPAAGLNVGVAAREKALPASEVPVMDSKAVYLPGEAGVNVPV